MWAVGQTIQCDLECAEAVVHDVGLAHALELEDAVGHLAVLLRVERELQFLVPLDLAAGADINGARLCRLLCADALGLDVQVELLLFRLQATRIQDCFCFFTQSHHAR